MLPMLLNNCGKTNVTTIVFENKEASEVRDKILKDLSKVRDCQKYKDNECELFTIKANPPILEKHSQNQEVILIWDKGLLLSPLTLYSPKIVGHYIENKKRNHQDQPYFLAYRPEISIPKAFANILNGDLKKKPHLLRTKEIDSLKGPLENKFRYSYKKYFDHGTILFNQLAELNPDAKFVIIHPSEDINPCNMNEKDYIDITRRIYEKRGKELSKIIRDHNIDFVNFSFGDDILSLGQEWREGKCSKTQEPTKKKMLAILKARAIQWQYLKEISETIFFQSGPYPKHQITKKTKEEFYGDCLDIPNRIRVGYLKRSEQKIAKKGLDAISNSNKLDNSQKHSLACVDIYLNNRINHKDSYLYSTIGIGHSKNIHDPSTSNSSTPVLSYFNYLWRKNNSENKLSTKEAIFQSFDKLIIDPYKWNLFIGKKDQI